MNKPSVVIYVNPTSDSTKILLKFIGKFIDQINEHLVIKMIKVTKQNVDQVKAKGIERTPTLVYERKKYVSVEKIIKILTPPAEQKDHYGYGITSSDELVHTYHDAILNADDDEDALDEDNPENRADVIRQKMAAMQKRRPEMSGVDSTKKLKGGRKLKNNPMGKRKFESDDDFVKASRTDNIESTPIKGYMDEADGALLLEEYYLEEAKRSGKQVGQRVSRRR